MVQRWRARRSIVSPMGKKPPGLSPLDARAADVRVSLALRVWDVVKATKLLRAKADRAAVLAQCERRFDALEALAARLRELDAAIFDAELSSANEETAAAIGALSSDVEAARGAIWDWAASFEIGRAHV